MLNYSYGVSGIVEDIRALLLLHPIGARLIKIAIPRHVASKATKTLLASHTNPQEDPTDHRCPLLLAYRGFRLFARFLRLRDKSSFRASAFLTQLCRQGRQNVEVRASERSERDSRSSGYPAVSESAA